MQRPWQRVVLSTVVGVCVASVIAQEKPRIEFKSTHLAGNVHMLSGAGGNVAVCTSERGALLVDSEYGQLADDLIAKVAALADQPIRLVINTHWHFDHVGGNEQLAAGGALIVAHEDVRRRMSTEQVLGGLDRKIPPSPAGALPTLTFRDELTLHWGSEEIRVLHVGAAHTDGDSFVLFKQANVLHVGDVWFNGMYPFIDVNAGGSIDGMIAAVDRALALADEKTRIIPGHGPVGDGAELREYREMLVEARERIGALVKQGKSREDVIAAQPTKELDARWGQGGFQPDQWVGLVYDGMVRPRER